MGTKSEIARKLNGLKASLTGTQLPGDLIRRADEARDGGRLSEAAELYEEVLARKPRDAAIHIQCGHMNKELRRFAKAEKHYLAAQEITPDDPDLSLQLGHFYKVQGRIQEAIAAYRRAEELNPEWAEPTRERLALTGKELKTGAWSRHNAKPDKAESFLKNVPVEKFIDALQAISDHKAYHLLEGIDQRLSDPSLDETSLLLCLSLCMEAGRTDLLAKSCHVIMEADRLKTVPIGYLADLLSTVERTSGDSSRGEAVPLEAQNAMCNVALAIIYRQRQLIADLMSQVKAR